MKVTYTQVFARRILLAFVSFMIIVAIIALFVRNSITQKLQNISKFAHSIELIQAQPEHILLLLNKAENDFQESLTTSDQEKISAYKNKLSLAFAEIDTLLKESPDTSGLTAFQHAKVHSWYNKKIELSDSLYKLKRSFDSLLVVYASYNQLNAQNLAAYKLNKNSRTGSQSGSSDTARRDIKTKRKGLLARLKDAITNKDGNNAASVIEINHNHTKHIVDSTTKTVVTKVNRTYGKKFQMLQQKNMDLLQTQKELVALNVYIITELEHIVDEEKTASNNLQDEFKNLSFKNYEDTTMLLNKFYLAALFLVLLFASLLIAFIVKLDRSETLLREENNRSIAIAKQKMDLLLHMSHEIRNPLTAIQGFLYIFSKSALTPRQADMLGSIRLSSDMLIQTLNDTLDAAKMENSEFKLNLEPFNPDFALKEAIDSMAFSAAKKGLSLHYEFEGDHDAIVIGDSFRLKQIMNNLLSNAIKYTGSGGIKVKATLNKFDGSNRLKVDISDTGEGISAEQQSNLFSKYYQTNSAKGKLGTGLGLYICRELISFQKGNISVKSEPSKGSTFSFYIPYADNAIKTDKADQASITAASLLNGIRVLAVDDNELNLMFLKTMTAKLNVRFYEAANGKEALELLEKEQIDIVLTDIEMPEMNGHELIAAIRKLGKPRNKVPVIIMSGSGEKAEDKKSKKETAGVLVKPFTESELVKKIIAALKH